MDKTNSNSKPRISDAGKTALNKALNDAMIIDTADDIYKLANNSATEEFNDSLVDDKGQAALRRNDDIIFESLRLSNGWQKQYLFSLTKIRNLTSKNEILEEAIKSITGEFSCACVAFCCCLSVCLVFLFVFVLCFVCVVLVWYWCGVVLSSVCPVGSRVFWLVLVVGRGVVVPVLSSCRWKRWLVSVFPACLLQPAVVGILVVFPVLVVAWVCVVVCCFGLCRVLCPRRVVGTYHKLLRRNDRCYRPILKTLVIYKLNMCLKVSSVEFKS